MTYYKQCGIQRNSSTFLIWLPEKFAVKDKVLKLKMTKNWHKDWRVIRVFSVRLTDIELQDQGEIFVSSKNVREMKDVL